MKPKTAFKTLSELNLPCDICTSTTIPMIGAGWVKDRILCSDRDCGGEIEFATSTPIEDYE